MIYLLLGEGFEEVEAVAACDVLRRARLQVELVGIGGTLISRRPWNFRGGGSSSRGNEAGENGYDRTARRAGRCRIH